MDVRLVALSQLAAEDLKRLAVLHHSVMHTLLSDLGLPIVWRFYQIAQRDRETLGFCAVSASGELLGWAMGSPHPDRINAQLRAPLSWFLFQMLRVTLTRPAVLWQLVTSVLSTSNQTAQQSDDTMELTYIGVSPAHQGKGIGRQLLSAFIEASRANGFRSIVLSVEKENPPAIQLYKEAGFRIIKTFSEGRYQRHRMELTLA
jgi:ribosomal protein S18 acetylase RimI-like enzyme